MKLLDDAEEAIKSVHDYFGYKEDWVCIPLDDGTEFYWWIGSDSVFFAETEKELEDKTGQYFSNEIYRQRHLPKHVYPTDDYTMICVDTHTDGNKFLQIFDNSKRRQSLAE